MVERKKQSKRKIDQNQKSKKAKKQKKIKEDVVAKLGVECVGGAWDA